jgi:predicted kinase
MEAIIFCGVQASGKSTFYAQRFSNSHLRINLDMLKTRRREKLLLQACIAARQAFVVDNTSPTREDRARYIVPARAAGFRIVGYYFRSNIQDALRRNSAREGSACIPVAGVLGTYARLQLPTLDEGFDELHYVFIDPTGDFVVRDWDAEAEHEIR